MRLTECRDVLLSAFLAASLLASASSVARSASTPEPLVIQEQGSFAVGGTMTHSPGTFDPLQAACARGPDLSRRPCLRVLPDAGERRGSYRSCMWHGAGQFSKTWETTADGREGFQNIFLRRGFRDLSDRPAAPRQRRAQHGRRAPSSRRPTSSSGSTMFRVGLWPNYFDGVQFAEGPGDAQPVLPLDDAEHRAVRYAGHHQTPSRRCSTRSARASSSRIRRAAARAGSPRSRTRTSRRSSPSSRAAASSSPKARCRAPMPSAMGTLEGVAVPHRGLHEAHQDPDRRSTMATTSPSSRRTMPGAG